MEYRVVIPCIYRRDRALQIMEMVSGKLNLLCYYEEVKKE